LMRKLPNFKHPELYRALPISDAMSVISDPEKGRNGKI